jgi:hypothetical protein
VPAGGVAVAPETDTVTETVDDEPVKVAVQRPFVPVVQVSVAFSVLVARSVRYWWTTAKVTTAPFTPAEPLRTAAPMTTLSPDLASVKVTVERAAVVVVDGGAVVVVVVAAVVGGAIVVVVGPGAVVVVAPVVGTGGTVVVGAMAGFIWQLGGAGRVDTHSAWLSTSASPAWPSHCVTWMAPTTSTVKTRAYSTSAAPRSDR